MSSVRAQSDSAQIFITLPLVDVPYQYHALKTRGNLLYAYANPSMGQSLAVSNNTYITAHWGIKKLLGSEHGAKNNLLTYSVTTAFDLVSMYLPTGMGWLHEEYHRAVLTRRHINSFNDMNTFPIGQELVAVRKINDSDLQRLSDDHKPDFIRLMAAGLEGQYHQIRTLQQYNFYYNQNLPHVPLYWLSTLNNIFYVIESGNPDSFDKMIDEANEKEGTDISKRDFTGPDFTAWADALFFPDKPYAQRGVHPSGVGINRYIKPSQLTPEALSYLRRQGRLQWLNILSPNLLGYSSIKLANTAQGGVYGNFAVRQLLTSFGSATMVDVFFKTKAYNLLVSVHRYANRNSAFPGLEFGLYDYHWPNKHFKFSPKIMLWQQPRAQKFDTSKSTFGGLLGCMVAWQHKWYAPYIDLQAKTAGWVMGHVFLEPNFSIVAGLVFRLHKSQL